MRLYNVVGCGFVKIRADVIVMLLRRWALKVCSNDNATRATARGTKGGEIRY